MIYWYLNGHQIDFTVQEYSEMAAEIRRKGLVEHLSSERPALLRRLLGIIDDYNVNSSEPVDDVEKEFVLEQMIFDLESKI